MNIRKATTDDIRQILQIYAYARTQMKRSGNPGQWKDSYPALEIIEQDIQNGTSYVIEDTAQAEAESEIAAVFVLIHGDDPTYRRIENGSWLNHEPYAAVHRIASSGKRKGILRCCLSFCEARAANIRIDTHADNHIMQHLLESSGYCKCGRIYVADGSPRIAYQKKTDVPLYESSACGNNKAASTPSS